MAKTSAAVKNRYAAKAYDRLSLFVPKGKGEDIKTHADLQGETLNGYITRLIRADMGISETEWKQRDE